MVVCLVTAILFAAVTPPAHASKHGWVWRARYKQGDSQGQAVVLSPDGTRVFVSGTSKLAGRHSDAAIAAYDAETGSLLWAQRFHDAHDGTDLERGLAASPDGTRVYVTVFGKPTEKFRNIITVAYDASTGQELWQSAYKGIGKGSFPEAMVVSPDGNRVFVVGYARGESTGWDYLTIAYDAVTGERQWAKTYDGPAHAYDYVTAATVSPDSSRVFVTGSSDAPSTGQDIATIAYQANDGQQLWMDRFDGSAHFQEGPSAIGVSPEGLRVFVTGFSMDASLQAHSVTLAYATNSGSELWTTFYTGPGNRDDAGLAMGVSPDGTKVYVTGLSETSNYTHDYVTIAYDSATGSVLWTAPYDGLGDRDDQPASLCVSPDGSRVYVTGFSASANRDLDYATIAYDASTGHALWTRRYDGPAGGDDRGAGVAVSPSGSLVFVTGASASHSTSDEYATLAYPG